MNLNNTLQIKAELTRLQLSSIECKATHASSELRKQAHTLSTSVSQCPAHQITAALPRICHSLELPC